MNLEDEFHAYIHVHVPRSSSSPSFTRPRSHHKLSHGVHSWFPALHRCTPPYDAVPAGVRRLLRQDPQHRAPLSPSGRSLARAPWSSVRVTEEEGRRELERTVYILLFVFILSISETEGEWAIPLLKRLKRSPTVEDVRGSFYRENGVCAQGLLDEQA